MTLTDQQKDDFAASMEAIAERHCLWLMEHIQDGKGNPIWDALKSRRTEFGRGVYAPFLIFKTAEEAAAYLDTGEPPASADNKQAGAYIDTTCIDEFNQQTGGSFDPELMKAEVGGLIEAAQHPWQQPVMVFVVLSFLKSPDGGAITAGISRMVDWWDTEAETVPYPKVTKAKVRKLLSQQQTPMVALSTRNPLQAGKNLNVWMDVCAEMNLTPWIDAETPDALKHLSAKNRANTISIPFS